MIIAYLLTLIALVVYSYSQIDLNLTLLQTPWFLAFQHTMVQLGYFNRPLSTFIFSILSFLFLLFYILFLRRAEKLNWRELIIILTGISLLGLMSYPAFSHDIFNYIYSGRLVMVHHANPYVTTPLMFPADEWIRFMQWTHVTFAWGPLYLLLLLPFYLLGFGKFILTLISFKLMAVLSYLGSCWVLHHLSGKKGLVLFALNPLIIYEAVVAAHVDIVMLGFMLLAVYFWTINKKIATWVFFLFSVGIKYATVLLAPVFLLSRANLKSSKIWLVGLAFLGASVQFFSRELLPHYFIVPIGIASLYPNDKNIVRLLVILGIVLLLIRYLPFMYTGEWVTLRLPL